MTQNKPQFETRTTAQGDHRIAYQKRASQQGEKSGLVFLCGFQSDMGGDKASFLQRYADAHDYAYLRFDYFGHGASSGDFADGTISHWHGDVLHMLDTQTQGRQILVGSSFGGWQAVLAARARPERIAALVLIAPAIDMTERLMWQQFDGEARRQITENGVYRAASDHDDGYAISRALIEDGRKHCLLDAPIELPMPIRILHGQQDDAVPWELSLEFARQATSPDLDIILRKNGDHRLSTPADLALLASMLDGLIN